MPSTMTKVDIINYALIKIGDSMISSPTENTPRAKTMNLLFDGIRDDLLRSNPWNFAIKQTGLAANPTAPVFGYETAYDIPNDLIKMLSTEDNISFVIEGRQILTDTSGTLNIRYVHRVTDETLFDPMFTQVLKAKLAFEASLRLTSDLTLQQLLRRELDEIVIEAKAEDGKEDDSRRPVDYGWEISRDSFTGTVSTGKFLN